MTRAIQTASEIRQLVKERVHALDGVAREGVQIRVPLPQRTEPDGTGCNWSMVVFGNARGHETEIAGVVAFARGEVNLPPGD